MGDDLNYELLNGSAQIISKIVGFILGLFVVLIALYLTLVTSVDALYLTIPAFRVQIKKRFDGKALGGLRILSADAIKSVYEAYISGQNPLYIYLKKRLLTYIMATIMMVVMLQGGDSLRMFIGKLVIALLRTLGFLI